MNEEEFARALLAHERKEWQDPEKILSQLKIHAGMVIADLGCGPGYFTIPFARAVGPEGRVHAVDSSSVMLEYLSSNIARSKIGKKIINMIESDISRTHITSSSVDLVFLGSVLHDIERKEQFFSEVRRIMKPKNSRFVNIDWKKEETEFGPEVEIRLSEEESRKILRGNGFEISHQIDAGKYHYGFICKQSQV